MSEVRCSSPICIVTTGGVRGRMFTPDPKAIGMATRWCPQCIRISGQMQFFSHQTAEMVRNTYEEYINTDLPAEVKLILEQFTREIIKELGEEL